MPAMGNAKDEDIDPFPQSYEWKDVPVPKQIIK